MEKDNMGQIIEASSEIPSALQLAVGGMTCVACVRAITEAVSEIEGVSEISVNQLGKSASVVVARNALVDSVVTLIEDIGYECQVVSITPIKTADGSGEIDTTRTVALEFKEMRSIPKNITTILAQFESRLTVLDPHSNDPSNVLRLNYSPLAPEFTIRTILSVISTSASPPLAVAVFRPPSSDDIARRMYRKEQMKLLLRLVTAVVFAIPIFIIGIVYMSLVKEDNPGRQFFGQPVWAGQVSRGEWALFILATPIMFYSASEFHRRSLQELWFMWRPGSRASLATRFLRFGSMNLLISLGVSVAYFSSIAELAISASRSPAAANPATGSMTYFDSVAFLTMFLLIGRFIEAFSKHQASNAITLLGKLRSPEALLVYTDSVSSSASLDGSDEKLAAHVMPLSASRVEKISTDLLEVGDIVRIPPGASPPADGAIVASEAEITYFDESSLTGESKNVAKRAGDQIFVGTINKLRAVDMRVEAIDGETMLEQVIDAVRQGQTKRAPIERIVDVVTSYFVPIVTGLAIITWVVWLSLGLSGALAADNLANSVGGWPIWSLEFAISVFVIACPCGIGLAAPTALLVGSGLAAKYGILARGGGEAFQEASQIDVIVFDKTGTLTEGSEPKVTDEIIHAPSVAADEDPEKWSFKIAGIVLQLASASSHPLCVALRQHFHDQNIPAVASADTEEHPGCGMKGAFRVANGSRALDVSAILGNETWLSEHGAVPRAGDSAALHQMRLEGKSVVLLALSIQDADADSITPCASFEVVAMFAIADPIRPEAPAVVAHLHAQGIETWMISGDNAVTARAVAQSVGILAENVIAGVLPHQKAEKIQWLQTLPRLDKRRGQGKITGQKNDSNLGRKIVAMVGDGINDAPALTAADVGIAMGSGSDIALSSAKFVLLSSNLHSLLILTDLSRKVFKRIKFNFGWATVYNLITLPIAAGVIYPAHHARLSPVWSSLAMALSSTSVVCSSLLLRRYKPPEFKDFDVPPPMKREKNDIPV